MSAHTPAHPRQSFHPTMDGRGVFDDKPALVYWEMTQACDLACQHCRAEAIPDHHPLELTTAEGKALLRELSAFGDPPPHLVMTGGDALKRADLFELLAHAIDLGLPTSVAPSATHLLSLDILRQFKDMGVHSISLSLDGSRSATHDAFRGVDGCFEKTIVSAHDAREVGLPLQVNTLVTADTLPDLPAIYALVRELGLMRWSLFFLINIGRGQGLESITPAQAERVFNWIEEERPKAGFAIGTTEAPPARRVTFQRLTHRGMTPDQIRRTPAGRGFGIRDGNGIMFISHLGAVTPSGFVPLAAGNVRQSSPVELYRHSDLFTSIRDTSRYSGKCGQCGFRNICGGSRARAYAATGDILGSDPLCAYEPRGMEALV